MPATSHDEPVAGPAAGRSVLKVFLFTDLVDSTSWKKTLGDRDYATGVLAPHDRLCRSLIAEYHGASLNNDMGDGYLATFPTPGDAVGFALRFHDALARQPWGESVARSGRVPATRIGIHLGEHIELDQPGTPKLSGQAVDLAARVMGLGQPGQTLLTRHAFDSARQYVRGNPVDPAAPLAFVAHGRYRFKGNEDDPLEIFGVAADGSPTLAPPPDSEKAKRVKVDEADDTGSWRPAVGLAIPRRDGWLLEKQIGEGGFGEVWLSRHKRTKEQRVFKFCFDADKLRSFKRELTFFKLIQRELGDRADLVKLFEVQVEKPPYFLESEYIPDGDLGHWLERSGGFDGWPLSRRLAFLAEAARAVAAAHSLGIIHKDLKPSNILVRPDAAGVPHPVLADFGIGVLADRSKLEQGNITETGFTESMMFGNDSSRTGTRLYAPPESQLGRSATTGTDVYALGVMLFQFAAAQFKEPLGVGWEEKIDAGDPDRTELLRGDIRAATYALPEKRLPAAVALADRLEALDTRVAERKAAAEREAEDRRREERGRRAKLRRRVLAALGVVLVGIGIAAVQVQRQRDEDRVTAEKQRADDRIAADEKRQADLRQTRAESLVRSLATADTPTVPRIVEDLADLRDLARPKLVELAAQPVTAKAGLHARLALLPVEPQRVAELAAYLPACQPTELLLIRDALAPHAAAVAPPLWAVLADEAAEPGKRVRAAAALAGLAQNDPRWTGLAPGAAAAAVKANPVEFVAWSQALEPVRGAMLPALVKRYPSARERIESGKLAVSDMAAEASGFDLTANLLARYAADRPADLADLAMTVDARHHGLFAEAIAKNRAAVVPLLTAELGRRVVVPQDKLVVEYLGEIAADDPRVKHAKAKDAMAAKRFEVRLSGGKTYQLTMESADFDSYLALRDKSGKELAADDDGGGGTNSSLRYSPPGDDTYTVYASSFEGTGGFVLRVVEQASGVEEAQVTLAQRQANAAAVLLTLGVAEPVWPLFRHTHDPTVRCYLVHRVAGVGVEPAVVVGRFRAEADVSAKRALLLALGEFPPAAVADRGLTAELVALYREHPDSGLHGSIEWLLRQKWGRGADLTAIESALASQAKGGDPAKTPNGWYVNGEGQTFTVIRGPVSFTMGSPRSEPQRFDHESPHSKRIPRSFAVATKEVTNGEYLKFRPSHSWVNRYSLGPATPAIGLTWYNAAEYCNWLSARENIPQDQWCYTPNPLGTYGDGMRVRPNHLGLTGYRLPTEAEWEFVARAGSDTSRHFGRSTSQLGKYARFFANADDTTSAVGSLRPNDLGAFDMLGNAYEWVNDPFRMYRVAVVDDIEHDIVEVNRFDTFTLRSGAYDHRPELLRSSHRFIFRVSERLNASGFRPARTLPDVTRLP